MKQEFLGFINRSLATNKLTRVVKTRLTVGGSIIENLFCLEFYSILGFIEFCFSGESFMVNQQS